MNFESGEISGWRGSGRKSPRLPWAQPRRPASLSLSRRGDYIDAKCHGQLTARHPQGLCARPVEVADFPCRMTEARALCCVLGMAVRTGHQVLQIAPGPPPPAHPAVQSRRTTAARYQDRFPGGKREIHSFYRGDKKKLSARSCQLSAGSCGRSRCHSERARTRKRRNYVVSGESCAKVEEYIDPSLGRSSGPSLAQDDTRLGQDYRSCGH